MSMQIKIVELALENNSYFLLLIPKFYFLYFSFQIGNNKKYNKTVWKTKESMIIIGSLIVPD